MKLRGSDLRRDLKTAYYQAFYRKPCPLRLDRGVVSFTFDDVPRSALDQGLPLLERAGYRATWYLAGKFAADGSGYVSYEEARGLRAQGHDIGCHTFRHGYPRPGSDAAYVEDARRNRGLLEEQLGGGAVRHFAYPYGALTLGIKRRLGSEYSSLRSTRFGVNVDSADLSLLLAARLYSASLDREAISALLRKARERRGWLIFYTHGIGNPAPDYGISPLDYEWVLSETGRAACDVLTIDAAYRRIRGGDTDERSRGI